MAESGKNGDRTGKGAGGGGPPTPGIVPENTTSSASKRHGPRGIVIHLTGTEGQWDSLDDSELIFSLDNEVDYPSISLSKERQLSVEDDRSLQSQTFHVPLSPSSPGSLGNCSNIGRSFLSPGSSSPSQRPLASLVKSLSTELELKEGATLRPKPLLSLVKSISTEISRSEPEVSQSKSDSRLNLHLWKQLTQTKTRSNGDSRTAPPSPSSLSPSGEGLKGSFFKMELEDTKRKLSEVVHEPLSSMFNKILREESTGSPKHQRIAAGSPKGLGRDGSVDTVFPESPVGSLRKPEGDILPVFNWPPVRLTRRSCHKRCPIHHDTLRDEEPEPCTDNDTQGPVREPPAGPQLHAWTLESMSGTSVSRPPQPLPRMTLFWVAVLSYAYFILPLSSYLSGLALGLVLGFLLGLFLIRMGSSWSHCPGPPRRPAQTLLGERILAGGTFCSKSQTLKVSRCKTISFDQESACSLRSWKAQCDRDRSKIVTGVFFRSRHTCRLTTNPP